MSFPNFPVSMILLLGPRQLLLAVVAQELGGALSLIDRLNDFHILALAIGIVGRV